MIQVKTTRHLADNNLYVFDNRQHCFFCSVNSNLFIGLYKVVEVTGPVELKELLKPGSVKSRELFACPDCAKAYAHGN